MPVGLRRFEYKVWGLGPLDGELGSKAAKGWAVGWPVSEGLGFGSQELRFGDHMV